MSNGSELENAGRFLENDVNQQDSTDDTGGMLWNDCKFPEATVIKIIRDVVRCLMETLTFLLSIHRVLDLNDGWL